MATVKITDALKDRVRMAIHGRYAAEESRVKAQFIDWLRDSPHLEALKGEISSQIGAAGLSVPYYWPEVCVRSVSVRIGRIGKGPEATNYVDSRYERGERISVDGPNIDLHDDYLAAHEGTTPGLYLEFRTEGTGIRLPKFAHYPRPTTGAAELEATNYVDSKLDSGKSAYGEVGLGLCIERLQSWRFRATVAPMTGSQQALVERWREYHKTLNVLQERYFNIVGGVGALLDSFATLKPALKAMPALWDFIPVEYQKRHTRIVERKSRWEQEALTVDTDALARQVLLSKLNSD